MAARLCAYTLTVQGGHSVIPPSRALRPRRTKTTLRIGVVIGQTIERSLSSRAVSSTSMNQDLSRPSLPSFHR
jgi:hypothetical protein